MGACLRCPSLREEGCPLHIAALLSPTKDCLSKIRFLFPRKTRDRLAALFPEMFDQLARIRIKRAAKEKGKHERRGMRSFGCKGKNAG